MDMAGLGRAFLLSRSRKLPSSLTSYSTRCGRDAFLRNRDMDRATPMKMAESSLVMSVAANVTMMTMASSLVE